MANKTTHTVSGKRSNGSARGNNHSSVEDAKHEATNRSRDSSGLVHVTDERGNTVAVYQDGRRIDD